MNDRKMFKWLGLLLLLPVLLAVFAGDNFRYPCQDPKNWDKEMCKLPVCDVTRTCPEHIFKGQRDPRLGPPPTRVEPIGGNQPQPTTPTQTTGVNCK
jgi:hypothetical protein